MTNPMNCMSEIGKPLEVDPRIASLLAENERLRTALRDYGQHQQKSCLDLPATETQFCYCGLTAALAGTVVEAPTCPPKLMGPRPCTGVYCEDEEREDLEAAWLDEHPPGSACTSGCGYCGRCT